MGHVSPWLIPATNYKVFKCTQHAGLGLCFHVTNCGNLSKTHFQRIGHDIVSFLVAGATRVLIYLIEYVCPCVLSVVLNTLNPMDCSLPRSSVKGKNTGVGCHFPAQVSHPRLLHWQADSLPLVPPGKLCYLIGRKVKSLGTKVTCINNGIYVTIIEGLVN